MDFSKEEFHLGKLKTFLSKADTLDWEKLTDEFLLLQCRKYTIENDKLVPDGDKIEYNLVMINPKNLDVIAYCVIYQELRTIEAFVVDSSYRHKGYGQRFLEFCIQQFHINTIEVYASNYTAVRLYKRVGFAPVLSYMQGRNKIYRMMLNPNRDINLEAYLI